MSKSKASSLLEQAFKSMVKDGVVMMSVNVTPAPSIDCLDKNEIYKDFDGESLEDKDEKD